MFGLIVERKQPLILLLLGLSSVQIATAQEKADADQPSLSVLLGGGVVNQPRYPGSRFDFTRGLPMVSINYDRYFFGGGAGGGGPAGLGAYLLRNEHWVLGLSVGGDSRKPRRASDDPVLRGWGDIPGSVRGGVFAGYSMDWISAHGSVTAGGHHQGVTASLNVQAELHPMPALTLSFGPEVIWGSEQYGMTFFGINATQSEIAGIAPYRVRAGFNTAGVQGNARYMLTSRWSLAAHVSYGTLLGDAADSPVTTDKTQRTIAAFVLYRF